VRGLGVAFMTRMCNVWARPRTLPTRRFYETHGYREAGRIPDFYAPGDDRVIFLKAAKEPTSSSKR
jgi:hypothetical protein